MAGWLVVGLSRICRAGARAYAPMSLEELSFLPRDVMRCAVLVPSFQLGTVTLASCLSRVSVRANRSTSGFPNALVSAAAALRRVTLPHLLASYN